MKFGNYTIEKIKTNSVAFCHNGLLYRIDHTGGTKYDLVYLSGSDTGLSKLEFDIEELRAKLIFAKSELSELELMLTGFVLDGFVLQLPSHKQLHEYYNGSILRLSLFGTMVSFDLNADCNDDEEQIVRVVNKIKHYTAYPYLNLRACLMIRYYLLLCVYRMFIPILSVEETLILSKELQSVGEDLGLKTGDPLCLKFKE